MFWTANGKLNAALQCTMHDWASMIWQNPVLGNAVLVLFVSVRYVTHHCLFCAWTCLYYYYYFLKFCVYYQHYGHCYLFVNVLLMHTVKVSFRVALPLMCDLNWSKCVMVNLMQSCYYLSLIGPYHCTYHVWLTLTATTVVTTTFHDLFN